MVAENGFLPDVAIRSGIRHLLRQRLRRDRRSNYDGAVAIGRTSFIEHMKIPPLLWSQKKPMNNIMKFPVAFFQQVLGPRLKYSSAYWPDRRARLWPMLSEQGYVNPAGMRKSKEGQNILELGCGWGSLTLWVAENYPDSHITAVSNSQTQRQYIQTQARNRNLSNVRVDHL